MANVNRFPIAIHLKTKGINKMRVVFWRLNLDPWIASTVIVIANLFCAVTNGALIQVPSEKQDSELVSIESLKDGFWVSPVPANRRNARPNQKFVVKAWFQDQFLGDGESYAQRALEFKDAKRTELRTKVVNSLKHAADKSYVAAESKISKLVSDQVVEDVKRHWIINGFTCTTTLRGAKSLKSIPGVSKVFITSDSVRPRLFRGGRLAPAVGKSEKREFDPAKYKHPWYCRALMAERVWREFGVTGSGTLNIVHDFNFVFPPHLTQNLADCVGLNFNSNSRLLTTKPGSETNQDMHGTMCATIICGAGTDECKYEFGIAPEGKWAGVIAQGEIESSVEWAIEQSADTYSMSFSQPGLKEYRTHWRKIMEHGSFCGVFFVSGAGNFGLSESVPTQMRTPEDIPNAVFAAAGVHRDLSRTEFSSKGPVVWKTKHYQDGEVQKPEVCAFNFALPSLSPNGTVRPMALNGNSFAGPMFCGSIALMLSADPDLLPWDLKDIITSTAMDVGPQGVDFETGHGLINCYRAVKEVLRRKAIREGKDATLYSGRAPNDMLNLEQYQRALSVRALVVGSVAPRSPAAKGGIQRADVIQKINGNIVRTESQLRDKLKKIGSQTVSITVRRGQKQIDLKVQSGGKGLGKVFEQYRAPVFK